MANRNSNLQVINEFLSQNRIAMAGVSRNSADFSTQLFAEFCRRGYDMVPVNPGASEIFGRRCFARVREIQPPVKAVLFMTKPVVTEVAVKDCAEVGVEWVWMYRGTGTGAVSAKALEFCQSHGIKVVPGECPYMFFPKTQFFHRLHGFIRKIEGKYPTAA